MNEVVAYKKVSKCSNKALIRNLASKCFNELKYVYTTYLFNGARPTTVTGRG